MKSDKNEDHIILMFIHDYMISNVFINLNLEKAMMVPKYSQIHYVIIYFLKYFQNNM